MKKPFEIAAEVKPSEKQLLWQETEYAGLIHFGFPTIVNQEWSDGTVSVRNPKLWTDAKMKSCKNGEDLIKCILRDRKEGYT